MPPEALNTEKGNDMALESTESLKSEAKALKQYNKAKSSKNKELRKVQKNKAKELVAPLGYHFVFDKRAGTKKVVKNPVAGCRKNATTGNTKRTGILKRSR